MTASTHGAPPAQAGGARTFALRKRAASIAKPTSVALLALALWEILVRTGVLPRIALAAPSEVAAYLTRNIVFLGPHVLTTLIEVLLGFAVAFGAGALLGILITQSRVLEEGLLPLLIIFQVIPVIALAPLLVLLLGFGLLPKVAVAALIAFFPVVVNTITGMKSLPAEVKDLAAVLRATRIQALTQFAIPNALPNIFAGAKIAAGLCVVGAVVGEFITSESGLGYLVLAGTAALDPAQVFAAIVLLAVMGIAMYAAVGALQWLLVPWARSRD